MTAVGAYRLGVDFGTSTTVAMLQQPDGRIRPLLFDGSPLLASAVLLGLDGHLHTGRDAAHLARGNPEGLEPNPKRRIDDGTVLLGTAEVRVGDLVGAVFERVAAEARQVGGGPGELVLTHPAGWGPGRRRLLAETAEHTGLGRAYLVSEPVAAATYFVHARAATLAPGSTVLIYDLGAGTCDITLLRRSPHGFDPIATDGLNDTGGLDVDAAIVAFLQATYGDLWTDGASRRQVWDEVRTAKEMLSRTASTIIAMPALGRQVPLGREQLDLLARPVLRPTVAMVQSLCREAGIDPRAVAGLFLVGGASRTPLVATMLHEALGVAPIATDQPELVVAEGALQVVTSPTSRPADPVSGGPFPATPVSPALTSSPFPVSPAALSFGGPTPVTPVSPAIGPTWTPAQRPVPQPVPQPVALPVPPPMPVPIRAPLPPPPPRRSRAGLGIGIAVAAGIVVLALLVGGSVLVYNLVSASAKASASSSARDNGSFHPSIDVSIDPINPSPSVKFPMSSLPANMCEKVDVGALSRSFEKPDGNPRADHNASALLSSAGCSFSIDHNDSSGTTVAVATVSFTVYLFSSPAAATSSQKDALSDAKLNKGTLTNVTGLGEEAFATLEDSNAADPGTEVKVQLQARDGNLQWNVNLNGSRVSGKWSSADFNQILTNFIAAAKSSYAKYLG